MTRTARIEIRTRAKSVFDLFHLNQRALSPSAVFQPQNTLRICLIYEKQHTLRELLAAFTIYSVINAMTPKSRDLVKFVLPHLDGKKFNGQCPYYPVAA